MKFTIKSGTKEFNCENLMFNTVTELKVEEPEGWRLKYKLGGFVHKFDYCQSSGGGNYYDEYYEEEYVKPIEFSDNAKRNAELFNKKTDHRTIVKSEVTLIKD